jgi:hypothetical protein
VRDSFQTGDLGNFYTSQTINSTNFIVRDNHSSFSGAYGVTTRNNLEDEPIVRSETNPQAGFLTFDFTPGTSNFQSIQVATPITRTIENPPLVTNLFLNQSLLQNSAFFICRNFFSSTVPPFPIGDDLGGTGKNSKGLYKKYFDAVPGDPGNFTTRWEGYRLRRPIGGSLIRQHGNFSVGDHPDDISPYSVKKFTLTTAGKRYRSEGPYNEIFDLFISPMT